MPLSLNVIRASGVTGTDGTQSLVFVTYEQPHFSPNDNKSIDVVPAFMYLGGSVGYYKDNMGNIVVRNKSGGEA